MIHSWFLPWFPPLACFKSSILEPLTKQKMVKHLRVVLKVIYSHNEDDDIGDGDFCRSMTFFLLSSQCSASGIWLNKSYCFYLRGCRLNINDCQPICFGLVVAGELWGAMSYKNNLRCSQFWKRQRSEQRSDDWLVKKLHNFTVQSSRPYSIPRLITTNQNYHSWQYSFPFLIGSFTILHLFS